jgi:outer membrane protein OmpA-like peptidoglycan-associated protein
MALASCLWGAIAFAQDIATAAPAVANPSAESAAPSAAAAPSGDEIIHLHMPVRHRAAHAAPKPPENIPADNPTIDAIGADTTAPPAVTAPVPSAAETPPEAARPGKSVHTPAEKSAPAIPFSFGEDSGTAPPEASAPPDNPKPQAASKRETKTASLPPKPEIPKQRAAPAKAPRAAIATKDDEHSGLTKRGAVLFEKGVSNPSPSQFQGVKLLAGDVSTALEAGAGRVQLEAYGGAAGDKSSDARRLSLKRALAVRQLLIDNGVPSNRIDVRAMGGTDDNGPNDRVDVFLRAS